MFAIFLCWQAYVNACGVVLAEHLNKPEVASQLRQDMITILLTSKYNLNPITFVPKESR